MTTNNIPKLQASDIHVRPGIVTEDKGISLLLYCDSRYVMTALDSMYGKLGWQRHHKEINGSVYCIISVWCEERQCWIERTDVGVGNGTEEEKSKSSDSFKRCAVNFQVSRPLYSTGLIWLKPGTYRAEKRNGKTVIIDSFYVEHVAYDEEYENITELVIKNQKGVTVFEKKVKQTRAKKADMQISLKQLGELNAAMEIAGVSTQTVLENYGLKDISEMTPAIYQRAMRKLKLTQKKVA